MKNFSNSIFSTSRVNVHCTQCTVKCVKFLYLVYRQIIILFFNNLLDTQ